MLRAMSRIIIHRSLCTAAACAALALVIELAAGSVASAQSPPTPNAPGTGPHGANRAQWEACRKQADDQKLARGEARREFMRNCVKNSSPGGSQQEGSQQEGSQEQSSQPGDAQSLAALSAGSAPRSAA
jgi:hypothetical protein